MAKVLSPYRRIRSIPILMLVIACLPFPARADSDADIAAIRASGDEWIAAFRTGDIEALMALYMPDALVALHGKPALRGIAAIRAYFEPGMGKSDVEFILDIEEIQVHGNVAHLVSKYWYTAVPRDGSEPYRDAGRSALIYKRDDDGHWKIYLDIDQATPDVAFPPPPGPR
jgi:uncharacterized protein (TIGR02246 family)